MVSLSRRGFRSIMRAIIVGCAMLALVSFAPVKQAHAQTGGSSTVALPTGWAGGIGDATTPTGNVTMGTAHSFGTALAVNNLGLDYGAMFNASLARFIPVFVGISIFGVFVIAAKGVSKMAQGAIRRNIK